MTQPQLSDFQPSDIQRRVMKWLGNGWRSELGAGSCVLVNGEKICTLATMRALQKAGYVTQGKDQCWEATEDGRNITGRLCL
ncbi:hypothetical protein [Polaromonas sp.]|uniref:hypothetical protein n=1 Tax=Polaromonas sp. TaxID=1869339 RepID=UPI003BB6EEF0